MEAMVGLISRCTQLSPRSIAVGRKSESCMAKIELDHRCLPDSGGSPVNVAGSGIHLFDEDVEEKTEAPPEPEALFGSPVQKETVVKQR